MIKLNQTDDILRSTFFLNILYQQSLKKLLSEYCREKMDFELDCNHYFQDAYSLYFNDFHQLDMSESVDVLQLSKCIAGQCDKIEEFTKTSRQQATEKSDNVTKNQLKVRQNSHVKRSHIIKVGLQKIKQIEKNKKGFSKETSQLSQNMKSILVKYFLRCIKLNKLTASQKQAIKSYIDQGNKVQLLKQLCEISINIKELCISYIDSSQIAKDIFSLPYMQFHNKLLLVKYIATWSAYLKQPTGHNQWKGYKLQNKILSNYDL